MKALRVVLISLGVVVLAALAAGAYLLGPEEIPKETTYRIDLTELRRLAGSLPGDLPLRINHELIARAYLPRAALFAGESFDPHPMVHGAYQIAYPSSFIVVDAAMSAQSFRDDMAGGDDGSVDHEDAWQALTGALERAEAILLTHEHSDHLNGIVAHPKPEVIGGHVRLNREQLADPSIEAALRERIVPLEYDEMLAFAPGVVLLRAAGHTPGSQMIFVTLADGSEWLLLGDVAWHMRQIEELHYRPRLVTALVLGEDRAAVMAQFRALHELMKTNPEVRLVSAHDEDQRAALVEAGVRRRVRVTWPRSGQLWRLATRRSGRRSRSDLRSSRSRPEAG
jgi:glyoxylase-like metal-dependent hydrolase (beta-lactamase superfamily II)